MTIESSPIDELKFTSSWTFRHSPEIIRSIRWLNTNRAERAERMHSFVEINGVINGIMASLGPVPDSLKDIRQLQSLLRGIPIPSLERIQSDFYYSPEAQKHIQELFQTAKENYPSWAKINPTFPSFGTPAMGALIEGFGAYLGKLSGKPEDAKPINRTYVLAFEELLIRDFSSSPLLDDLIGWMCEEKSLFPEDTQQLIDSKVGEKKEI